MDQYLILIETKGHNPLEDSLKNGLYVGAYGRSLTLVPPKYALLFDVYDILDKAFSNFLKNYEYDFYPVDPELFPGHHDKYKRGYYFLK